MRDYMAQREPAPKACLTNGAVARENIGDMVLHALTVSNCIGASRRAPRVREALSTGAGGIQIFDLYPLPLQHVMVGLVASTVPDDDRRAGAGTV